MSAALLRVSVCRYCHVQVDSDSVAEFRHGRYSWSAFVCDSSICNLEFDTEGNASLDDHAERMREYREGR